MPAGPCRVMGPSVGCLGHRVALGAGSSSACGVRTASAVVSLAVPCHCASSSSSETTAGLKHRSLPNSIPCLLWKRGAK